MTDITLMNDLVSAQLEIDRLQARITALEAQLQTVLDRESATTARYDAKLDALEAQVAAADRLADEVIADLPDLPDDDSFMELIYDAMAEADRAIKKFPQPNYVITKIAEEAGEVVKAAVHMAEDRETVENPRGEMKQVLAMIYRLWVDGDQVHGLPPVGAAYRAAKGE